MQREAACSREAAGCAERVEKQGLAPFPVSFGFEKQRG